MFQRLLVFMRRLPVAKYLKPLWKGGLKLALREGGDALQGEMSGRLQAHGEQALPSVQDQIDKLQARVGGWIDGLPFPAALEAKIKDVINTHTDELQKRLNEGVAVGSIAAVQDAFNAAFDRFQSDLASKIDAL